MIDDGKYNKSLIYFLACSIIFSLSPVFCNLLGVNGNIIFIIILSFVILIRVNKLQFTLKRFFLIFYLIFFSVLFSMRWQEISLIYYQIYLLISLLVIFCINDSIIICLTELLSRIILFLLIGAIIGFLYALWGGKPLLDIVNPDGRHAYLYLSTMTNWSSGVIIRPSGIFDEPGAFSFIICAICSLREMFKLNRKVSLLLMSLGMITLSIAHVIYFIFFLLSSRINLKKIIGYSFILFIVFIVFQDSMFYKQIEGDFLSRFEVVNGRFAGDNRSELLLNAYSIIKHGDWFWGGAANCIFDVKECNIMYPPFGENILSPFALTGLFMSLPYYFVLLFLAFFSIKYKNSLHIFGFMLLLIQRPYLFSFGYSLLIVIICFALTNSSRRVYEKISY